MVADWDPAAADADLLYTFFGCPNLRAALNGGCRIYGGDITQAKPAEVQVRVTSHDLTVDPANPGVRIVYVHNKGPAPISGILEVTLTTSGDAPTGPPTCAPSGPGTLPTPEPTPNPQPTPAPTPEPAGNCGGTTARITNLNLQSEVVTVQGSGDMTGWWILSTVGGQEFYFPDGFMLAGQVKIESGQSNSCSPSSSTICWNNQNNWNNNGDTAELYDCAGQFVNRVRR